MSKEHEQALTYVAQALNEYANTMQPTVRGPFLRECQAAIKVLESDPAPKPVSDTP
jgi:hypothetical protein